MTSYSKIAKDTLCDAIRCGDLRKIQTMVQTAVQASAQITMVTFCYIQDLNSQFLRYQSPAPESLGANSPISFTCTLSM